MSQLQEKFKENSRIVTSKLIAYAVAPSDELKHEIVNFASESLRPIELLEYANTRIAQCHENNPMLWFRLFRAVRSNEFDLLEHERLKVVSLEHTSKVREAMQDRIADSSPYPKGTWVIWERTEAQLRRSMVVLHGKMENLDLVKRPPPRHRNYSVICRESGRASISFTHVVPIK